MRETLKRQRESGLRNVRGQCIRIYRLLKIELLTTNVSRLDVSSLGCKLLEIIKTILMEKVDLVVAQHLLVSLN
jgi:hypothetical protein